MNVYEVKRIKPQPLKLNRRILTWMCVLSSDETETKWTKLAHLYFIILLFSLNIIALLASMAYFLKYWAINLEESLFALLQMIGVTCMQYILIILIVLRSKISAMFQSLSEIYIECM